MNKKVLRGLVTIALIGILTASCATMEQNPKTTVGAVGGGALGGLILAAAGGNAAAIAAGAVGGILLGGMVGNLLDERDKRLAAEAARGPWKQHQPGTPFPGRIRIAGIMGR